MENDVSVNSNNIDNMSQSQIRALIHSLESEKSEALTNLLDAQINADFFKKEA